MREIKASVISDTVRELFLKANTVLPCDTAKRLEEARDNEPEGAASAALKVAVDNLRVAKEKNMPICQDTGMAVVFVSVGNGVTVTDGVLSDAINEGVRRAYKDGYFRCSVVSDPLFDRKNTTDNTPAVIYTETVAGDKIRISVEPKGFGSENMSRIKMFNHSVSPDCIVDFVKQTVKEAGGNPCPPVVVGVGIGGTFDYAAVLAKKALTRGVSVPNPDPRYAELEKKMLDAINETGVGAQGFGGKTTALAVSIESFPTHIAGLPVAVNINCHVARHAECEI